MKAKFHTLCLHAGQRPDPSTKSRAVPIYQTTSYVFDSVEHAANLFDLKEPGNIYSRIMNPTVDVLEQRLAALEGGSAALALSSGQAAITLAILNLAGAGQNIVSSSHLYGGTYNLFAYAFPRLGLQARFADPADLGAIEALIDDQTRAVYVESIGNPRNSIVGLEKLAAVAHRHGLPLVVDNTVTTPYLLRPFEKGADIIVHSLTKFIGGHGTAIGGAIIEKGSFNWGNGKFPGFTEPDPSYHGITYWEQFAGPEAAANSTGVAFSVKARVQLLRDLGPCLAPQNAFLFLQGLETLPLRMKRHSENALVVARWLEEQPAITWVNYPGLKSHPDFNLASTSLPDGAGAIIGFGVRGGYEAAVETINAVKLISHLANIGDAKSLIIHPASTTHRQLSQQERLTTGVTEDFIRLSVGLEDPEEIIADLAQALLQSQKGKPDREGVIDD